MSQNISGSSAIELPQCEDSNISLVQSEPASDTPDRKIRRSETKSKLMSRLAVTQDIDISDLFEYRWPPDDDEGHVPFRGADKEVADYFVLQEVVSSMLEVKSFKRKYPDLYRRPVDGWEKDWLMKKKMLPKGVGDLGLTALRSDEILNLLERDYPDFHEQVVNLFHERKIQSIADQQKEHYQDIIYQSSAKGSKLDTIRKKSMKSLVEYNRSLNQERRKERRYYWDLQTMQIHVSHPRDLKAWRKQMHYNFSLTQNNGMGEYPASILPGQYCSKYRKLENHELGFMPLNKAIYDMPDPYALKAGNQVDINLKKLHESLKEKPVQQVEVVPNKKMPLIKPEIVPNSELGLCSVCRVKCTSQSIKCHDCGRFGHPSCMDLKDVMIPFVRRYNWCCIDCKKCHNCSKSTDEEKMIFCDRCDRGYHIFCVGMSKIPEGSWECTNCVIKI